ncbi:MAG: flagellar basal body protein [Nannocystaceae bacterium]|nr:flagellar basal body protein [Nannocystaceae bacterium]
MAGGLTFHRRRHAVLAGNVANADTPGYRPLELERGAVPSLDIALARTSELHQDSLGNAGPGGTDTFYDDEGAEAGLDGNTVSVDRELAKVDANRVRYVATSRMISKRMAALRYAATDGVG